MGPSCLSCAPAGRIDRCIFVFFRTILEGAFGHAVGQDFVVIIDIGASISDTPLSTAGRAGAPGWSSLLGASRRSHLGRVKVLVLRVGFVRIKVLQHPLSLTNHVDETDIKSFDLRRL
jgi:hypothetical protein